MSMEDVLNGVCLTEKMCIVYLTFANFFMNVVFPISSYDVCWISVNGLVDGWSVGFVFNFVAYVLNRLDEEKLS